MKGSPSSVTILLAGLLLGAGLGLFLLSIFTVGGRLPWERGSSGSGASIHSPVVGSPAPEFELETPLGEAISLSSLKGKPVLINFWATWCGPCVEEMPTLERYYKRYSHGLSILAVNADEPGDRVVAFVKDMGLSFPILLDPGAKVQGLYRLRGYPTTFLVDSKGIVRVHHIGPLTEKQLDGYLKELGIGE